MRGAVDPNYLDTARGLARRSGEVMRKNFTLNMRKEWKDDRSPTTKTDMDINALVIAEIKRAYPDHGILAEEGIDHDGTHEYTWVCDPIDGTHNFSHGLPTATFAIALLREGQPLLGVIYDPFQDRMYYAEKGKGAFLNQSPIRVSSASSVKKTMMGLGKTRCLKNFFPAMDELYQRGVSMVTGLSIHYFGGLVASGEFAASIFGGTSCHDMTPAKIIVEEAGGRVTDLYGGVPERFDTDMPGQICSNGLVHDEIVEIFKMGPDLKSVTS